MSAAVFSVIIANVSTMISCLASFLIYSPVHSFLSLFSGIKRGFQFTGGSTAHLCDCICQTPGLFRTQNAWSYPSHFALQKALGVQCPPLILPLFLPAESWIRPVAPAGITEQWGAPPCSGEGGDAFAQCLVFSAHPGSSSLVFVDRERHLPQVPHWARCFGGR